MACLLIFFISCFPRGWLVSHDSAFLLPIILGFAFPSNFLPSFRALSFFLTHECNTYSQCMGFFCHKSSFISGVPTLLFVAIEAVICRSRLWCCFSSYTGGMIQTSFVYIYICMSLFN